MAEQTQGAATANQEQLSGHAAGLGYSSLCEHRARGAATKASTPLPVQPCCIIPAPFSCLPGADEQNNEVWMLLHTVEGGWAAVSSHTEYMGKNVTPHPHPRRAHQLMAQEKKLNYSFLNTRSCLGVFYFYICLFLYVFLYIYYICIDATNLYSFQPPLISASHQSTARGTFPSGLHPAPPTDLLW